MPTKKKNKTKAVKRNQLSWVQQLADETGVDLTPEDLEDLELAQMQDELDSIPFANDLPEADWKDAEKLWEEASDAIARGNFDEAREGVENLRKHGLDCLTKEAAEIKFPNDISPKDQKTADALRKVANDALSGGNFAASRKAIDDLRAHAIGVKRFESQAGKRCKAELSTVGDDLEKVRDTLPKELADPGSLLGQYRALLIELDNTGGTGGLEQRIKTFGVAVNAFSAKYRDNVDAIGVAIDPRYSGVPALAQAFLQARAAAAQADSAAFGQAVDSIVRTSGVVGPAQQQWDSLYDQIDNVLPRAVLVASELSFAKGSSQSLENLGKFLNTVAPRYAAAGLADGSLVQALEDWIDTRRSWADRASLALSDAQLKGDLTTAFKTTIKNSSGPREALMAALCDLAGTAGAIDTAYENLLKLQGPWTNRIKQETKAQPVINKLVLRGVNAGIAKKLAIAGLAANVDADDLVQASGVSLAPTLTDLVNQKGAARTLSLLQQVGNEAGLRRFLDNSTVTPANLLILVTAGDVLLIKQNRLIKYRGCHKHSGQDEVEAAVDVQWRYNGLGADTPWGVVHVHYCSGLGNPAQRTTVAGRASYYHVKAGGNFGGSGGPIDNAGANVGLRGQINAAIGANTL